MHHCRPKLVPFVYVSLSIINEELNEVVVPMISCKMQGCEFLISRLVSPLSQHLSLLLKLHVLHIMIKCVIVENHEALFVVFVAAESQCCEPSHVPYLHNVQRRFLVAI